MTAKVLTQNRQMLNRSTYIPLTPDDITDKVTINAQEQFMVRVHKKLGSWVLPREMEDIGLDKTPQ